MRVFGIAGWSGSGKTTLIERLLPALAARGLEVSVVKHAHERFDIDRPGKDSHRIREAGAREMLVTSPKRWALIRELRDEDEWTLPALLDRLGPCDLVLVEGFKRDPLPKLEVHRPSVGKPLLVVDDRAIVAVATDACDDVRARTAVPAIDLDDIDAIALIVVTHARPVRDPACG